ncbi:MAG TPA: hypothetical protein VFS20_22970 [Longimicrobium sp.]|nr:hypothetical protein [Longimicrobium sp.]
MILSDGRSFRRFVAHLFSFLALLVMFFGALLWLAKQYGLNGQVAISTSPRVVLQEVTHERGEYRVMVSPAANPVPWQNTGIDIHPGDTVEIHAEGRVNINLNGLIDHVHVRHRIEARIDSALQRGTLPLRPDSSRLPERYYTEADRAALAVKRGWTGPGGYSGPGGVVDAAYPARTANKLIPEAPLGLLIGAVHQAAEGRAEGPARREQIQVGGSWRGVWNGPAGSLWFAVNDIWDAEDDRFPDKFYVDNLGFFFVRVVVSRG